MKLKINSIKNRIFSGLLSMVIGVWVLGVVALYYMNRIDHIRKMDKLLNHVESRSLQLIKMDNDFFDVEFINATYFLNKESELLDKRNELWGKIIDDISRVRAQNDVTVLENDLIQIEETLNIYNQKFLILVDKIYIRGFKDYGLEGQMRTYAHALENFTNGIELSLILSLRRHEKDFFLRNDTAYVVKLNEKARYIKDTLVSSTGSDSSKMLIDLYVNTFNQLAAIEKEIGLNSNEGLRNDLNQLTQLLDNYFLRLSKKSESWSVDITENIIILFSVLLIVVIVLTILWGHFVSNRLSRPIKRLDGIMRNATERDLKGLVEVSLKNPDSEVEHLSRSFLALMKKARMQMKEIKDKSKELSKQNAELKKLNQELDGFIYSTAHDLRSPLASLLGLANLAEMETVSHRKEEYMILMKRSIQKMDAFIKDVVAYSKNKKLDLTFEEFDIYSLINEVFQEHRYMPNADSITNKIIIKGSKIVDTDESRLRVILSNLISNAIRYADLKKYSPEINVQIEVYTDNIRIIFADNGIGIEQKYIKSIFNMFFRASETSSGSGLGLFILIETVKKMGGHVNVSSELLIGTTFNIVIPNNSQQTTPDKLQIQMMSEV